MVTVRELKRCLAALPDDMLVAVNGYEGGVTVDSVNVRVVCTAQRQARDPMVGELEERAPHGIVDVDLEGLPDGPTVLLLARAAHWSEG